jgi:hypothetical protein
MSLDSVLSRGTRTARLAFANPRHNRSSTVMRRKDFDLQALYAAMDEKRRSRNLTWGAVAAEINAQFRDVPGHKPIAQSTITRLATEKVSGSAPLQMMLWLDRTPESFVPGFPNANADRFKLRKLRTRQILRFDTKALYAAVNAQRQAQGLTWNEVAAEMEIGSANPLKGLARGGLTGFPVVMRIAGWLDQPAAAFTRASDR